MRKLFSCFYDLSHVFRSGKNVICVIVIQKQTIPVFCCFFLTRGQKLVGNLLITGHFPKLIKSRFAKLLQIEATFYKKISVINIVSEQDEMTLSQQMITSGAKFFWSRQ